MCARAECVEGSPPPAGEHQKAVVGNGIGIGSRHEVAATFEAANVSGARCKRLVEAHPKLDRSIDEGHVRAGQPMSAKACSKSEDTASFVAVFCYLQCKFTCAGHSRVPR